GGRGGGRGAGQGQGAAAPDGGAAAAARGVRAARRRGDVRAERGVLREAEERLPLSTLRRVSVTIPAARAEEGRARMLELFPEGFEEVASDGSIELVAYTDSGGEGRPGHAFC